LLQSHALAQALRPHFAKTLWAEVVGPQVAGVTQVEKVQKGTELVVRVKNSVWANELVLLKGDMIARLNKALGGPVLTDIHFKASGLSKKKAAGAPTEDTAPPVPSEEELGQIRLPYDAQARIAARVSGITDEALRARMSRTLLRAGQVQAWKRRHGWQPCARCGALTPPASPAPDKPVCPLCRAGAI
jgi:predicted nucleic acid-binding Zn ribbon protein